VLASVNRDRTRNPYARADTRDADNGSRKRTVAAEWTIDSCRLQWWLIEHSLTTTSLYQPLSWQQPLRQPTSAV